jgi:dolichyl-phosphate-mannose-protein mannosyltransferase
MQQPGTIATARDGSLAALVAFARREPGRCLAIVLALHVVVWTLLPALTSHNLQLDLVEDLALGREWQLGYWKHPPLPWWLADLVYRAVGDVRAVYLLGPLAAAACLYVVWLLGRDILGSFPALVAVLALEGVHFYNFSVVKFAHDQLQLPFWALTGLLFYRALMRGRALDWLGAGAALALCFWSKYAAFALAGSLGAFLLTDPVARRAWRTAGPYLMALAFLIVIAPNLWWLVDTGFLPFRYVDARARIATHWYQLVTFPLQWTASQIFFLLPAIALLALACWGSADRRAAEIGADRTPSFPPPLRGRDSEWGDPAAFARRYVTMLALGPFLVTTLIALLLGRLPVAMWGYPLWSFAPLAALVWLGPVSEPARLKRFAAGFLAVFVAAPVAYAAVELGEPLLRDRPKATQFPGRLLAEQITRTWHDKFGKPLAYVGGGEFATNTIAVYSPDRPHVIVHADPALSPWIDRGDLKKRGAVLVWEDGQADEARLAQWRAAFPGFDLQPPLILPRQTLRPTRPARIYVALVPPRP